MNGTSTFGQVWRIAWKDMRRIGGLWIALFLFWVACLGLGLVNSYYSNNFIFTFSPIQLLIGILVTATVYALGWAGLTYATEHDDGTYEFLRALPVRPQQVFYGKLFFGVNSTLLLILGLMAVCGIHYLVVRSNGGTYVAWRSLPQEFELVSLWATIASVPLAIVVGLFWSLRIKRPLLSLALAGACLPLITQACLIGAIIFYDAAYEESAEGYLLSGGLAATICVVLYLVDWRLALRWLPNYQVFANASTLAESPAATTSIAAPSGAGRLLWLTTKQNLLSCIGLCCLGIVLSFFTVRNEPAYLPMFAAGLLGIIAFRPEHKENRYRLLSQFGVGRTQYWSSRLLLPLLATVVVAIAAIQYSHSWEDWAFLSCFVTFAIGQFCSLAFSSIIIAIAATLLTALAVCGWTALCRSIGVPLWLTFGPVILLPLLASYLRVPRWFRDTGSWRQWVVPAIPAVLFFIGTPIATALYRINEIPRVVVPDGLKLAARTEQQEATIRKYEQAFAKMDGELRHGRFPLNADVQEAVRSLLSTDWQPSEELFDSLVEASRGEIAFPIVPLNVSGPSTREESGRAYNAAAILLSEAARAQEAGDVARAWDCLAAVLRIARQRNDGYSGSYGWAVSEHILTAAHPMLLDLSMQEATTSQQIQEAIQLLSAIEQHDPPALAGDYAMTEEWLASPDPALDTSFPIGLVPWEIIRSRRYRDYEYTTAYHGEPNRLEEDLRVKVYLSAWLSAWRYGRTDAGAPTSLDVSLGRLAAIGHYKQHGSYPGSFVESGYLSEEQGSRLQRNLAIVSESQDTPGSPFICQAGAVTIPQDVSDAMSDLPDGWVSANRFQASIEMMAKHEVHPLPTAADYEDWSHRRFEGEAQIRQQAREQSLYAGMPEQPKPMANPAEGHLTLTTWGSQDAELIKNEETYELLTSFINHYPESKRSELANTLIRESLDSDSTSIRVSSLATVATGNRISEFVPDVLKLVESDDLDRSSFAINVLNHWLQNDGPSKEQIAMLDPYLSRTKLDPTSLAMPIKNPASGHYYELLHHSVQYGKYGPQWTSWAAAERLAAKRKFKGMQGHLATITSKEESNFLRRAFVVPFAALGTSSHQTLSIWLGGQKSPTGDQWIWACGPEEGDVFYSQESPEGYANWHDENPLANTPMTCLLWAIDTYRSREVVADVLAKQSAMEDSGIAAERSWNVELIDRLESMELNCDTWKSAAPYSMSEAWYLVEYSPETTDENAVEQGEETEITPD